MERALEKSIWERAGSRCEYCQLPEEWDPIPFEIDHVIPIVHGGQTEFANLALACWHDNCFKGPNLAGIDPGLAELCDCFIRVDTNGSDISNGTAPSSLEKRASAGQQSPYSG